jgi:uncharacterized damage-inducible protein DinB
MTPTDCTALFQHAEWADALVWRAVLGLGGEDPELKEKLHHMHVVQSVYLAVWRAEPVAPPALETFASLAALREWGRRFYGDVFPYLSGLAPDAGPREVQLPWRDHLVERYGIVRPTTWAETALQVNLHSTYHRGQVNSRLRALGAGPPLTDFIVWIWMGRPAADWANPAA